MELDWSYGYLKSDFIHVRGMVGCIADYDRLYQQAFDHLTPGCWIEVVEFETLIRNNEPCDESRMRHTNMWLEYLHQATSSIDKPLRVAADQRQHLIDAGFEGVTESVYRLPFGTWPKDPKLKEIGRYQLAQMLQAVDSASPAIFTRILTSDTARLERLTTVAKKEFLDGSLHLFCNLHFVYGRKPTT